MKTIKILSLTMFIVLLTACSKISEGDADHDKLQIVATYSIIADMTENIVGEKAEVYSMVPIGTDPHMYDPLPKDTSKVSSADLVFYNGLNLETGKGWFQDLLDVTNKKDVAFAVSDEVSPMYLTEKGKETQVDPHAWLDIQNSIKYVDIITKRVIEKDPDNKEFYLNNQSEYVKKLNELDQYAKEAVEKIPQEKRILVTSEGAFKYFSKAYGFESAFIWEINTDSQGTPEQMKNIIKIIDENQVPALFLETSVNPKTMETIANETGVPIHSKIFTDSLAKKGEEGDTYIKMIKWNIDKVIEGLSQS
ncbi:metal ABC transporter substrate-binding protein [Paenibacillus odorifer]|jgi:ABC-type Zn uptake system ZnuABC Zn-binding protein ZnuA|uniref:Metal ABC transporter substrate-binding protein n=1 Tax=Paenibacillus odorifer TaxID=189426 RepID=A0A1R0WUP2_9BACL|nr:MULTISPECIES: metal ABC transporter substrate-binding protein [Paenibacillus]ETT65904.1 manganese ABC transporter substrate-binding lipoprotein [Paenibacillus sp. FSL H8-237]OMC74555.1 metal ABC transporter substrate-binding protein [Paenibacillus odorifer]OMC80530.1 metal ABC transporter substrate-binding protein [Paenibacillus odorifer]OMD21551.1 metal ABC transporter substrate-binding protein [Paenibacillus odorifer]OMD79203.1 metal ABC transporter substrate-binding protein [Paenibacillu